MKSHIGKLFSAKITLNVYSLIPEEGDCGSWVIGCDNGKLLGHIVAGHPGTAVGYIIPAAHIFDDVLHVLGEALSFPSQLPAQSLLSPPSRGWDDKSIKAALMKSTSDAGYPPPEFSIQRQGNQLQLSNKLELLGPSDQPEMNISVPRRGPKRARASRPKIKSGCITCRVSDPVVKARLSQSYFLLIFLLRHGG
jgi:hypothetical protein